MKKTAAAIGFLAFMAVLFSCGGEKAAPGAATAGQGIPPASGKAYDCKYFAMTVAAGWDAGPQTFGMVNVLPRGKVSPGLYFKFEGDGNAAGTAEAAIGSMIRNYGGSPMAEGAIAGVPFKVTTYSYSGMTQTMHVAFRGGTKITITVEGANAGENPDIRAMLATVAFK
jgi:hypothetical protein